MSYIPKYILKRMVPMDAVKAEEGGVVITFINVISPLTIDDIPEDINPLDYLEVKVDGEDIPKEDLAKLKIEAPDEGISLTMDNFKDALGKTLPVGGKLFIHFPTDKLKAGETHDVEINIKTDNPISIKLTRTVQ
ncbi:MAG: hypothetical protein ACTSU5_17605 [Promethearchaeota archaeon]